jgi:hypothetical protein
MVAGSAAATAENSSALMELEWARGRDERAHRGEQEVLRPSAPAEPAAPWWSTPWLADAQALLRRPEPEIPALPIEDNYDEEEELESAPGEPVPTVEPADGGDIAERLKELTHAQLNHVAEAFSLQVDGADEEDLRHSLAGYVGWASDKADDARDDPEAARAAGRKEAIGFIEEEIVHATATTAAAEDELEEDL